MKRTRALKQASTWHRHSFAWVTGAFFALTLAGHWVFGWLAFVSESEARGRTPHFSEYAIEAGRDTLENWQSEFLQLIWQVAGLAFLFYVGSPQSPEGDERKEEKIDALLRLVDPKEADRIIADIDGHYDR